jgi:hypothetical protein
MSGVPAAARASSSVIGASERHQAFSPNTAKASRRARIRCPSAAVPVSVTDGIPQTKCSQWLKYGA